MTVAFVRRTVVVVRFLVVVGSGFALALGLAFGFSASRLGSVVPVRLAAAGATLVPGSAVGGGVGRRVTGGTAMVVVGALVGPGAG